MPSNRDNKVLTGEGLEYFTKKLVDKFGSIENALVVIMEAIDLQANWDQQDSESPDFIKNKPTLNISVDQDEILDITEGKMTP